MNKEDKLILYREKIDEIDEKIKELLIERIKTVKNVAEYKLENNLEIFQSGRENNILNKISSSDDKNISLSLLLIYKSIMNASRLYQNEMIFKTKTKNQDFVCETNGFTTNNLKVGCQGREGAYSHHAAAEIFTEINDNKIFFYENFRDVFIAIENEEIDCGVIPLENSNAGIVKDNYTLIQNYNFFISAEIIFPVRHCLLINKNADISDVKEIYSHEQSFDQCQNYLIKHKIFNRNIYSNNAAAAEFVSRSSNTSYAAIASSSCANLYGLKIAEENIQDNEHNNTRFLILSKKKSFDNNSSKVSIIVKLNNEPGSLYKLLSKFSYYGVNMTKIESQPLKNSNFEYLFFIDFEGNMNEKKIKFLLESIKNETEYLKFLGNYISFHL